jgi:hypothetical protein
VADGSGVESPGKPNMDRRPAGTADTVRVPYL